MNRRLSCTAAAWFELHELHNARRRPQDHIGSPVVNFYCSWCQVRNCENHTVVRGETFKQNTPMLSTCEEKIASKPTMPRLDEKRQNETNAEPTCSVRVHAWGPMRNCSYRSVRQCKGVLRNATGSSSSSCRKFGS